MIEIRDLLKTYETPTVLDRLTQFVRSEETLGFLGPNDAGKTTSTIMRSGMTQPDKRMTEFSKGRRQAYPSLHTDSPSQCAHHGSSIVHFHSSPNLVRL